MCVEPASIAPAEEPEGGLTELLCEAAGFVAEKVEADRDGVVTHIERIKLKERARRVAARARAVAA
jgi:hypothetical protein